MANTERMRIQPDDECSSTVPSLSDSVDVTLPTPRVCSAPRPCAVMDRVAGTVGTQLPVLPSPGNVARNSHSDAVPKAWPALAAGAPALPAPPLPPVVVGGKSVDARRDGATDGGWDDDTLPRLVTTGAGADAAGGAGGGGAAGSAGIAAPHCGTPTASHHDVIDGDAVVAAAGRRPKVVPSLDTDTQDCLPKSDVTVRTCTWREAHDMGTKVKCVKRTTNQRVGVQVRQCRETRVGQKA